jgi:hypothetical protein
MNKSSIIFVSLLVIMVTFESTIAGPIDWGCTLSCGEWNWCRTNAMGSGDMSKCGPEPSGCDCTHFAGKK